MKFYVKLDNNGSIIALFKRLADTTEFVWTNGAWTPTTDDYVAGLLIAGDPTLYGVDAAEVARVFPGAA